jgi:hypothetical protein
MQPIGFVSSDGGEIWFDNVLIQKNGIFIHKVLAAPNPGLQGT